MRIHISVVALGVAMAAVPCFAQGAPKAPRGQVGKMINEDEQSVTHHVEGSVNPRNIGNGMVRFVEVSQDRLSLNTFAEGQDGKQRVTLRMWERLR